MSLYLLSLLKLQLNRGLDTVACVLVSLFECQLHQMFVVRPCHVATHENDNIGHNLYGNRAQTRQVLDRNKNCETDYI